MQAWTTSGLRLGRRAASVAGVGIPLFLIATGCGSPAKDPYGIGNTVPVSGKVTFATKLPKGASAGIAFYADGEKSTKSNLPSSGNIDEQGNYTLVTGTKQGAPPGKYKVVIQATVAENPKDEYSPTRSVINQIYSAPKTTPLSAQVVENPASGVYDFTVK